MRTRTAVALVACLAVTSAVSGQSLRGDGLFRFTLLRAAPGRLLELVAALKPAAASSSGKALLLRHSQGDHWDLMVLQPIGSYAAQLKDRPAPLAPEELLAWQEDGFVRGPDIDAIPGFREGGLFHAEMFHALAGKRTELVTEREMENAYLRAVGRPANAIFVRELGASWDCFTLGAYRGWKHYAERDDVPKDKAAAAARAAGFVSEERIGPYLRSLIVDHHDSLLTPVR